MIRPHKTRRDRYVQPVYHTFSVMFKDYIYAYANVLPRISAIHSTICVCHFGNTDKEVGKSIYFGEMGCVFLSVWNALYSSWEQALINTKPVWWSVLLNHVQTPIVCRNDSTVWTSSKNQKHSLILVCILPLFSNCVWDGILNCSNQGYAFRFCCHWASNLDCVLPCVQFNFFKSFHQLLMCL